jgi:putative membrane protein
MQFLRILVWVVVAVLVTILASRNWHDVTVLLWGDIQADIKLPVLLLLTFLLGFLPPYLMLRAARWQEKRRQQALERQRTVGTTEPAPAAVTATEPAE